jgi:serine/threonine protein kinase
VVHRSDEIRFWRSGDLKLSNFVLDKEGRLRVIDFGGSATDNRATPDATRDPFVPCDAITSMTRDYHAPELDSGLASVSSKIDVYSCGVMFAKLRSWMKELGQRSWRDLGMHSLVVDAHY